jgi:hypothetical protein
MESLLIIYNIVNYPLYSYIAVGPSFTCMEMVPLDEVEETLDAWKKKKKQKPRKKKQEDEDEEKIVKQ